MSHSNCSATVTVNRATVIADLREAANAIRRLGWTTGAFWHPSRGVCAVGAIATAVHGDIPTVIDGEVKRFTRHALPAREKARINQAEKAVDDYILRHQLLPGLDPVGKTPVGYSVSEFATADWNDNLCKSGEQAALLLEAVANELEQAGGGRS